MRNIDKVTAGLTTSFQYPPHHLLRRPTQYPDAVPLPVLPPSLAPPPVPPSPRCRPCRDAVAAGAPLPVRRRWCCRRRLCCHAVPQSLVPPGPVPSSPVPPPLPVPLPKVPPWVRRRCRCRRRWCQRRHNAASVDAVVRAVDVGPALPTAGPALLSPPPFFGPPTKTGPTLPATLPDRSACPHPATTTILEEGNPRLFQISFRGTF